MRQRQSTLIDGCHRLTAQNVAGVNRNLKMPKGLGTTIHSLVKFHHV